MLILSRQENETVIIQVGKYRVECMVVEIQSNNVKLGFTAPSEIVIHRKEIMERIELEGVNRRAAIQPAVPGRVD